MATIDNNDNINNEGITVIEFERYSYSEFFANLTDNIYSKIKNATKIANS